MHMNGFSDISQLKYVLLILFTAMIFEGVYHGFLYEITIRMMPIFLLYLFPVMPFMRERGIYKLTFLIYAVHQPVKNDVTEYLRKLIAAVTPYAFASNIGTRILCLGIDFMIAGMIYSCLKKFAPKVLDVLTGGRT